MQKFSVIRLQVWTQKQGGQRTQADSVANLPDNSDKFSKKSKNGFP